MHGVCSYPTAVSGPALIWRAREVVWSLPEKGHWKSTSFFPLEGVPRLPKLHVVSMLLLSSYGIHNVPAVLWQNKVIFRTHTASFQSAVSCQ